MTSSCSYHNYENHCTITAPKIDSKSWTYMGWNTNADMLTSDWNQEALRAIYKPNVWYAVAKFNLGHISENLVLHYNGVYNTKLGYNGAAKTWEDLSTNNHHGTLDGGTWTGNSISFNGINERVIVPACTALNPNEFTIELVLKQQALVGKNRSIVFVKWGGYTIELNHMVEVTSVTPVFGVYPQTGSYVPAPTVNLNQVYYLAATYKNRIQYLYINGLLVNERINNSDITHTNSNLTIGSWTTSDFFNGEVYSVRFYNRKLTPNEIKQNYELERVRYNIE